MLLNEAAGTGLDAETLDFLRVHASGRIRAIELVVVTESSADALRTRAAAELDRGVDAVVVRGGDGMVQIGVNLVAGTDVPLGIVPAGSGNDFARTVGIPTSPRARHEQLLRLIRALEHPDAATEWVDALRVETGGRTRWVANSVNFGFDALVNERANTLRRVPGTWRYLVALLQVTREFEPRTFTVSVDGRPANDVRATLIAVLNGKSVGGGIKIAPQADHADGACDVVTVGSLPKIGFLAVFPSAMLGLHTRLPQVQIERARTISVTGDHDLPVYADGEPLGMGGFRAELVPNAWRLLRG